MDILSRTSTLPRADEAQPGAPKGLRARFGFKPPERPATYLHYQAACEAAGVTHHNKTFRHLWDELTEQANAKPLSTARPVKVKLDGHTLTMNYYRNHGRYGWCLHKRSMATLLDAYEARVEARRPTPIEHGPPLPAHFNSRGSLRLAFSLDHYGDSGFTPMWDSLIAQAETQSRSIDSTVRVQLDEKPVTLGFFQEPSGRSRWFVHDDSLGVLRQHVERERAMHVPTAPTAERHWFGPMQAAAELGITRDHGGFRPVWSQIAAVASELPTAGDRARLHGPNGDVEIMRAGNGEKLKRITISKESLPVLSRAIDRQRFFERITWRARCSNESGSRTILNEAFAEQWNALKGECPDLRLLTGIPSPQAALTMAPHHFDQALQNVTRLVQRDAAFMDLVDKLRDSHSAAVGVQPQYFSR